VSPWRILHFFYLGRAILKGPKYLLGYLIRRIVRQATWRATRGLR